MGLQPENTTYPRGKGQPSYPKLRKGKPLPTNRAVQLLPDFYWVLADPLGLFFSGSEAPPRQGEAVAPGQMVLLYDKFVNMRSHAGTIQVTKLAMRQLVTVPVGRLTILTGTRSIHAAYVL